MPLLPRHGVEAPVCAVDEVDVGDAGRPVEVPRPFRATDDSMARGVIGTEVRLGLHDAPRRHAIIGRALERGAEELAGDELRGAIVERRGEHAPAAFGHASAVTGAAFCFARPRRGFDVLPAAGVSTAATADGVARVVFPATFLAAVFFRPPRGRFAAGAGAAISAAPTSV